MMRRLVIEQPMDEALAAAWATPSELTEVASFASHRRREWLAWRALVRSELGRDVEISYDASGAPVVSVPGVFISVSHCKGRIAVCFADRPCAVDIEPEIRDFSRAIPRYMTAEEQALSFDPLLPAVVWCAKEALYKYAGQRELDLLEDLRITHTDLAAGRATGRIKNGKPVELSVLRRDGFIAVSVF